MFVQLLVSKCAWSLCQIGNVIDLQMSLKPGWLRWENYCLDVNSLNENDSGLNIHIYMYLWFGPNKWIVCTLFAFPFEATWNSFLWFYCLPTPRQCTFTTQDATGNENSRQKNEECRLHIVWFNRVLFQHPCYVTAIVL